MRVVHGPAPGSNSYGFVKVADSYRMRGAGGRPKKITLKVSNLKEYAAKRGIDPMGAKLKKNILQFPYANHALPPITPAVGFI
jgi:hypothetical protein